MLVAGPNIEIAGRGARLSSVTFPQNIKVLQMSVIGGVAFFVLIFSELDAFIIMSMEEDCCFLIAARGLWIDVRTFNRSHIIPIFVVYLS